jgi:dihydropteroate synthase
MRHAIDGLILDPGFGWKTLSQTVHLFERLEELKGKRGRTILVGVSRKQHLGFLLQRELKTPETPGIHERLEAGLAETAIAVARGAKVIRTHDVAATRKFLALFDFYHNQRR